MNDEKRNVIEVMTHDPNVAVDNPADQVLGMIAEGADMPDSPPPPVNDGFDADFKKALERPILIYDDDAQAVKDRKMAIMQLRENLLEMMKEGRSAADILKEHQKITEENAKVRYDAVVELKRIFEDGDIEGAKTYREKINEVFAQMGIHPLEMPMTREERLNLAIERKEAAAAAKAQGNIP